MDRAGVRIMTRHGRRLLPAGQGRTPGPDGLALLQIGGGVPGASKVARSRPTILVAALPDGTAVSWNVRAQREWNRTAGNPGSVAGPQMPEQVAAELDAILTGLDVTARQASAVTLWLDALFEVSCRARAFAVTDFADLARLPGRGTPQAMDVALAEGFPDQQVLFAQLCLESLHLARGGNRRPPGDRTYDPDVPGGSVQ